MPDEEVAVLRRVRQAALMLSSLWWYDRPDPEVFAYNQESARYGGALALVISEVEAGMDPEQACRRARWRKED